MKRFVLAALLVSCAQQRLILHEDGIFEDTVDGVCFRYVAIGGQAWVVRVQCPQPKKE
jgi:hypothetical protein